MNLEGWEMLWNYLGLKAQLDIHTQVIVKFHTTKALEYTRCTQNLSRNKIQKKLRQSYI